MAIIPGRNAGGGGMNPILGQGGGRADIIMGLLGNHPVMPGQGPIVNAPGGGGQHAQIFGYGLNGHPFYNENNWLNSLAYQREQHAGPVHPNPGGEGMGIVPNRTAGGLLGVLQGLGNRGAGRPVPQAPAPRSFREALIQRAMNNG